MPEENPLRKRIQEAYHKLETPSDDFYIFQRYAVKIPHVSLLNKGHIDGFGYTVDARAGDKKVKYERFFANHPMNYDAIAQLIMSGGHREYIVCRTTFKEIQYFSEKVDKGDITENDVEFLEYFANLVEADWQSFIATEDRRLQLENTEHLLYDFKSKKSKRKK
ncbi:MAG: hypothetical protein V1870_02080 [Candidatus Aenigmatarchaeota archaeon]